MTKLYLIACLALLIGCNQQNQTKQPKKVNNAVSEKYRLKIEGDKVMEYTWKNPINVMVPDSTADVFEIYFTKDSLMVVNTNYKLKSPDEGFIIIVKQMAIKDIKSIEKSKEDNAPDMQFAEVRCNSGECAAQLVKTDIETFWMYRVNDRLSIPFKDSDLMEEFIKKLKEKL